MGKANDIPVSDDPMVSICIPVYNGGQFLKQAIESCLLQTYPNIEIIICDDRSTDNSLEIAASFSSSLIRVHQNDQNLGLVGNWQKCIELAKSDWIKFLFQDDLMEKDCVEKMMHACLSDNTRMSICAREFIFEANADPGIKKVFTQQLIRPEQKFVSQQIFYPEETARIISSHLIENVLGEPICLLFHKSLYVEVGGFDITYKQVVDYEFALKIVLNHPFSFIQEKLVAFRVHSTSTTGMNVTQSAPVSDSHRKMDASIGDYIRLLESYLKKKEFEAMKIFWGEDRIRLFEKYIYLRACKYSGSSLVRTSLKELLERSEHLSQYKYHYLKYKYIKYLYQKRIKPFLNR